MRAIISELILNGNRPESLIHQGKKRNLSLVLALLAGCSIIDVCK
jgi:hypothetical protein